MAAVSHTHPHTSETFGAVFQRGPAMADGGERSERARRGTMRDVDHTPRHGEDVSEVWARGGNERQAVRDDRESTGASVDE
nr:hypothetical protein [Haloprofundus salilacus]